MATQNNIDILYIVYIFHTNAISQPIHTHFKRWLIHTNPYNLTYVILSALWLV